MQRPKDEKNSRTDDGVRDIGPEWFHAAIPMGRIDAIVRFGVDETLATLAPAGVIDRAGFVVLGPEPLTVPRRAGDVAPYDPNASVHLFLPAQQRAPIEAVELAVCDNCQSAQNYS